MRVDRLCWARAVYQNKVLWGFKGIAKPSGMAIRQFTPKRSMHAQIVLCDERYIENLHWEEAKYVASDSNWFDDWKEFVEGSLHRAGCCPHGDAEERQCYENAVARMLNNETKRFEWARDRVDYDWICDSIETRFHDEESIFYFLEEHSIDAVWLKDRERWVNLEEVLGFCPSCDEALIKDDQVKDPDGPSHPFDKDCQAPHCESGASLCLFNKEGVLRDLFECRTCNWSDVTQDVGNEDETFFSKHGRPFNWPPGAPYPPRRSFSGFPMDVPPYEE